MSVTISVRSTAGDVEAFSGLPWRPFTEPVEAAIQRDLDAALAKVSRAYDLPAAPPPGPTGAEREHLEQLLAHSAEAGARVATATGAAFDKALLNELVQLEITLDAAIGLLGYDRLRDGARRITPTPTGAES